MIRTSSAIWHVYTDFGQWIVHVNGTIKQTGAYTGVLNVVAYPAGGGKQAVCSFDETHHGLSMADELCRKLNVSDDQTHSEFARLLQLARGSN